MAEVAVRPIEPHEYEAVGRLTADVYAEVLGMTLSDGYRAELVDVARRAAEALVLVAAGGETSEILGSITYVPGPESPYAEFDDADEAGIRMLVVAPAAQRQGIGKRLVQACVNQAWSAGKARLSLHTTPTMVGAQRLYERMGFRRTEERDWRPEPGVDLLGYVLELGPAPGR